MLGESNIQTQHYDFTPIAEVAKMEPHKSVDILAIVESHEPMTEFRSRKGNEMKRKQFSIVDTSNTVSVFPLVHRRRSTSPSSARTRWSPTTASPTTPSSPSRSSFPSSPTQSAVVSDFGGHSLSGFDSTSFTLNPDLPEAAALKQWYRSRGDQTVVSLSAASQPQADPLKRKTLAAITVSARERSHVGGTAGIRRARGLRDGEGDDPQYPA